MSLSSVHSTQEEPQLVPERERIKNMLLDLAKEEVNELKNEIDKETFVKPKNLLDLSLDGDPQSIISQDKKAFLRKVPFPKMRDPILVTESPEPPVSQQEALTEPPAFNDAIIDLETVMAEAAQAEPEEPQQEAKLDVKANEQIDDFVIPGFLRLKEESEPTDGYLDREQSRQEFYRAKDLIASNYIEQAYEVFERICLTSLNSSFTLMSYFEMRKIDPQKTVSILDKIIEKESKLLEAVKGETL